MRVTCIALGFLLPAALSLPHSSPSKRWLNEQRVQAVVDAFRVSWDGYYKYAFPHDELHPVTNGYSDSRNAWGASAVDALSTALIMSQKDIVNQILTYIPTIDYTKTATEVSLFETTIRYLGGMLSAYDLLTGPLSHLADNKTHVSALLTRSTKLGNALSYAFETPSGVPYNTLYLNRRGIDNSPNGLAQAGTLILEWVRLADLTGNKTYAALVEKAQAYLVYPSPSSSEPWPGLVGTDINVTTGQFLDARGGWTGGTDSFYEYLIKMYIYDPYRYAFFRERWMAAADSTIAHLTSHPSTRPDLTFLSYYDGQSTENFSQHLAGFAGGNFILGGLALNKPQYINYGLELTDAWHETYIATATRIGPESFSWDADSVPADQKSFFEKNGFYITSAGYILRPEVIESYYYAYRATGDPKYQDWAWDAFEAIVAATRVGSGFSAIRDVNQEGGGGYTDFQESFWFAEVLKYSYLIQSDQTEEWQIGRNGLGGRDRWVFNTEAHPVRVV